MLGRCIVRHRIALVILFFFALSHLVDWGPFNLLVTFAQTTQVTGQVKDVNGIPYAGASMRAGLVFAGTPVSNPTVTISTLSQCRANGFGSAPCQVPFNPSNGPFTLDGTGNIPGGGITLQDNALVTPAGTQWAFSVSTPGAPPPLGTGPQTCSSTLTVTGASQSVSPSFIACPALSTASAATGGLVSVTGVYLSPSCIGNTPPCINIPTGGGCYTGTNPQGGTGPQTSNSSGLITFSSGFPTNPPPQIGQLAWVMQIPPSSAASMGNFCDTQYNANIESLNYVETVLCGNTFQNGGLPITITAINPGVSLTLSRNCNSTQNGTNAILFYAPNIYSQMVLACENLVGGVALGGVNVHLALGLYSLDNTGNGTQSACGCVQLVGCTPNTYVNGGLSGENVGLTQIYTPPWYNHNGDLGTILAGGNVHDILIDGQWVNIAAAGNHGTVWDGTGCGSYNFAIVGYNLAGAGGVSETIYANSSVSPLTNSCEMRNFYIATADSALALQGGGGTGTQGNFQNAVIISRNPAFICPFAASGNGTYNINGGYYSSSGRNRAGGTGGVIACPEDSQNPTGDKFIISNAALCMTNGTNIPAINFTETSGSVVLNNVTVNSSPSCTPGANAGGITTASGVTVQMEQSTIKATGTGNTVNNPAGATFFDGINNTFSGGAGYTGAGVLNADAHAVKGSCTGTVTASSTLGLYGTGPNETLTPCTSAAIGTGLVVSGARTLFALNCTASAAGISASDVCIVLQNGANVGSCSLNAVTTCTAALNVALADGDRISLEITTGVADTLANVKAIADWN